MNKRRSFLAVSALIVVIVVASLAVLYEEGFLMTPSPSLEQQSIVWQSGLAHQATSFAVADGKVFVTDDWGDVYTYDAQTGESLWNATVGGYGASAIVVYEGKVYVPSGHSLVNKLNENTGKVEMQFTAPAEADRKSRAIPRFFLADGRLFASFSGIAVYNANTGELFWESSSSGFKFGNAGATAPQSSFIYIDGTTRINFNNGDRMWNYPGFSETPLVSKDKVVFWDYALNPTYYEPGHEVICVNANSGKKLWSYDAKVPIYPPAISNDLLLFGAQDGYFYALNMADGTLKWRTFVDRLTLILSYYHPTRGQSGDGYASGKSLSASLPQINNQDQIIWSVFINEDEQNRYSGTFMVLDLSNGDTMWVTPIASNPTSDAYTKSSTSLSSNTLYVTRRRTLFCLDATTGNIQWTRTYDHNLLSPIAADNKVFVVGDGYVTAYK